MESLILAQDERWRRAYHMQVERFSSEKSGGRVSNAWVTCPVHTDNIPKGMLIRDNILLSHGRSIKAFAVQDGPASD